MNTWWTIGVVVVTFDLTLVGFLYLRSRARDRLVNRFLAVQRGSDPRAAMAATLVLAVGDTHPGAPLDERHCAAVEELLDQVPGQVRNTPRFKELERVVRKQLMLARTSAHQGPHHNPPVAVLFKGLRPHSTAPSRGRAR